MIDKLQAPGRLSLVIPEVRPAFFTMAMMEDLQDLRGFRHVVVPAYNLVLKKGGSKEWCEPPRESRRPVLG